MPVVPFFALSDFGQMMVFFGVYLMLYVVAVRKPAQLAYGVLVVVAIFGVFYIASSAKTGFGVPGRVYFRFYMWRHTWEPPPTDTWWWKRDFERYLRAKDLTADPNDPAELKQLNSEAWADKVLQQSQGPGRYDQGHYDQMPYGQGQGGFGQGGFGQGGFGGPGGGFGGPPFGGGGGSFLGTAAAAAAGVVGGSLLLNGIRGMMGGGQHHQAFADNNVSDRGGSPWSDQSNSSLARDAGVNDIGRSDNSSRSGLFDQAASDRDQAAIDHQDDLEQDAMDDFGDDNDSDYA